MVRYAVVFPLHCRMLYLHFRWQTKALRHPFQARNMLYMFHYFGMTNLMIFHKKKISFYFSRPHPLSVIAAFLALKSTYSRFSFFLFVLFQFLLSVHILLFVFLLPFSAFFVKFLLILPYFYSKCAR